MMASTYPIRNAYPSVSLTKAGGRGQGNEAKEGTPLSHNMVIVRSSNGRPL